MVLKIFRSKKFAKRTLITLLILIIPAFVLWGVGSLVNRPEMIGEIDGQKIYPDDFMKSRQGIKSQILFSYYGNYNMLNQLLKDRPMINQMAWERLIFLNAARAKKIRVSNNDILLFLAKQPVFQRNGVFDRTAYDYILRNSIGLDQRQFEELVRENLQIQSLRQDILKDIQVMEEELLAYHKKANSNVELSYILIDKTPFRGQVKITAEETQKFYEENKDKFVEPAKTEVEYIGFPYGNTDEKDTVTRRIEEILPELKDSPAQFLEIAKKHDLQCGTTGLFSRKDVIQGITFFQQFPDTAFALKKDEISAPIFSSPEKGTAYILRKIRDIPPKQLSFQEVWGSMTQILIDQRSISLAGAKAQEIYNKITSGEATLEEEALALNLKVQSTGVISADEYIANIGPAKQIVALALKTGAGNMMLPMLVKKGAFLARVNQILPGDKIALNETEKANIRRQLLSQKQIETIETWLKEHAPKSELKRKLDEM